MYLAPLGVILDFFQENLKVVRSLLHLLVQATLNGIGNRIRAIALDLLNQKHNPGNGRLVPVPLRPEPRIQRVGAGKDRKDEAGGLVVVSRHREQHESHATYCDERDHPRKHVEVPTHVLGLEGLFELHHVVLNWLEEFAHFLARIRQVGCERTRIDRFPSRTDTRHIRRLARVP